VIRQAVILAGGSGDRMLPYTGPKCILSVGGKPLLSWLLSYLRLEGVEEFIVCLGHYSSRVSDCLTGRAGYTDVVLSCGGEALTIPERLALASKYLHDRFLVCYGDTLANVSISELIKQHEVVDGNVATLTTYKFRSQFGAVKADNRGRVVAMHEKPELAHPCNIGFMLCETDVIPFFSGSLLKGGAVAMFDWLVDRGLGAYEHPGFHATINTFYDWSVLDQRFKEDRPCGF